MSTIPKYQRAPVSLIYHKVYTTKICHVLRDQVLGGHLETITVSPLRQVVGKSNSAASPAISAEFVLTGELQQIKLRFVLSSYQSFSWKGKHPWRFNLVWAGKVNRKKNQVT